MLQRWERKKRKGEEQGMNIHPVATGDPWCNSPIETHQGPASCLLYSSEQQSPGGSGLEDTDSDDVRLAECQVVVVEVRKEKVGMKDEEEGWNLVVRRKRKKSAGCVGDGELSGWQECHVLQEPEWDTRGTI